MKKILVLILVASAARADVWYKVEEKQGKAVNFSRCEAAGVHVLQPGEFPADAVLPKHAPLKYWKKSGQTWVEMTEQEKAAADDADKAKKVSLDTVSDELVRALALVLAEELGMTQAQLEQKLKNKLK